jgi:Tol biopolymer transport system component
MGEVYRARDSKLARDVALKVLSDTFANDPERLARFQREAQVLASLNHPNIAAIYGLEEAAIARALVLELVDGPTLADRLATGPIPLDDALPLARQIADALEAAHEQGVVHRDLKPANIKLRPDGTVKVLDFGLAKFAEADGAREASASIGASQSPTITTPAMTRLGMILGTAAYMSPEQAKGRPADTRSDVWAFGCVLYEMLTGRRAFQGDDMSDTLAFVLTKEPDWNALPPATPPAIRRLIRRSLVKDRKRRLADIADARIEIDDAASEPGVGEQRASLADAQPFAGRRLAVWVGGLLAAAAIGAAATLAVLRSAAPDNAPEMRVDIVTPQAPEPMSFALSPDGRWLAFVAETDGYSRLWVRRLGEPTARVLPGTEGALQPFWSPDNRSIGFFASGTLKRIEISGGGPRTLANAAPGFGGTWNADGVILFASTSTTGLLRVSANEGGKPVDQIRLDPPRQLSHGFPVFLPGGREFLFYARGSSQGIYLGSLDSPETTRLVDADRPPAAYLPSGWLLYSQQGTLLARRLDRGTRALTGEAVTIANSLAFGGGPISFAYDPTAFSASLSGLVAYRAGGATGTQLTWFDRSGKPLGTLGARDDNSLFNPELSPDDRQVAVRRTVEGNTGVFVMDGVRVIPRTFDAAPELYPVWSPDGSWLAFSSARKGVADVYRKRSNGTSPDEVLVESPRQKNVDDWSPDGRFLLYNEEDPVTGRDLWLLSLDRDGKPGEPEVFLKTPSQEHRGQFSPNGRFIAYVSNESGRHEIFVRPFPQEAAGLSQISVNGGIQPRWSHDGSEIYYIAPDGKLIATPVTVKDGAIESGTPKELFQTRVPGGGTNAYTRPQYDVSRDGRFLANTTIEEGTTTPITLVINWKPPGD